MVLLSISHFNNKNILVTGATGAIGKELVKHLKAQPHLNVSTLSTLAGKIDIRNASSIRQALHSKPFDIIYHLAALNPFQSNEGKDYFEVNVQGTENILKTVLELKQQNKKMPDVFLASSVLAYEPEKLTSPSLVLDKKGLIKEKSLEPLFQQSTQELAKMSDSLKSVSEKLLTAFRLKPADIFYNDSKLLAELMADHYSKQGVPVKTGRLVNCYSQHSNQLPNQLVREQQTLQSTSLQNKDSQARDYLYYRANSEHDDVLRMMQGVAEKGSAGESYHIASAGRFVRRPETLKNLVDGKNNNLPSSASENPFVFLSTKKTERLAFPQAKTSPEKGIQLLQGN
jgi:nucleoside-diphosphate-sugar epimerase